MLRRLAFLSVLWTASCSLAFAAPDQWLQISSPHFTVITDSSDKQGRHILDQFERMRWVFQTLFPRHKVDPALPIVISSGYDRAVIQGKFMETQLMEFLTKPYTEDQLRDALHRVGIDA